MKAVSNKEEAICERDPETPQSSLDQSSRSEAKWKTALWSDKSKFEILFGNNGCCVLQTKEERDCPACYKQTVENPASLMVWGCIRDGGINILILMVKF